MFLNPVTQKAQPEKFFKGFKNSKGGKMKREKFISAALSAVIIFLSVSCSSKKSYEAAVPDKQEFRRIAEVFQSKLSGILVNEISNRGTVSAIKECSITAQELTTDFGTEYGVSIRRVSFKNRNVLNRPDEFESRVLMMFDSLNSTRSLNAETEYFEITQSRGRKTARYMKPIIVQPFCLNCHGGAKDISKEVQWEIRSRYKSDLAVNFKSGDLRGAISIKKRLD